MYMAVCKWFFISVQQIFGLVLSGTEIYVNVKFSEWLLL